MLLSKEIGLTLESLVTLYELWKELEDFSECLHARGGSADWDGGIQEDEPFVLAYNEA